MELLVLTVRVVLVPLVGIVAAWTVQQLRHFEALPPASSYRLTWAAPLVTIVIPARNEEANIQRCVNSYQCQDYPSARIEIVVIDDCSQDRTPEIVKGIAANDPRVRLIFLEALPPGWLGKPHACWQGYLHSQGQWLCFTDADTRAAPHLVRDAVAFGEAQGVDCVSVAPGQDAEGFWERVILPTAALLTAVSVTTDIRAFNDDTRPEGAAFGGFILVRREAYEAIGGHQAVAREVVEDLQLGRALKARGYRLRLMDGAAAIRVRMYSTFGQIWEGLSRNMALLAGSAGRALMIAFAAMVVPWLSVALLGYAGWTLVTGPRSVVATAACVVGVVGFGVVLAFHALLSRRMGIKGWAAYGLLFPVSYAISATIIVDSVPRQRTNRIKWKSRVINSKL